MTDQSQNPASNPPPEPPPTPPVPGDWREQRRAERIARHEARKQMRGGRSFGWFAGAILIVLGIIFLLQNMGYTFLVNWWALFILIPAYWSFAAAWNVYQEHGALTRSSVSSLVIGLLITFLALIFLLNLNLGLFWPVLLIIGGLALLFSAFYPR